MKPKSVAVSASKLVILALHNMEMDNPDLSGYTASDITEFISSKYNLDSKTIKPNINAVLIRCFTFGILTRKNGRYQLGDVPEPPADPKPGETKKEKLGAMIVEASNESVGRKRKKKSDVRMDDTLTLKPFSQAEDERFCKDCYRVAKKKRSKSKEDDDEEPISDRNYLRPLPGILF